MESVQNREYLGLPVPDSDEIVLLQAFTEHQDSLSVEDVYKSVTVNRSRIIDILEEDIEVCTKFAQISDSEISGTSPEEINCYTIGIWAGYRFIIASVTYIHFLRSNHSSLEEFLSAEAKKRDSKALPLGSDAQYGRLVDTISGFGSDTSELESFSDGGEQTLADYDANAYLFKVPTMSAFVDILKTRVKVAVINNTSSIDISFIEGFEHGLHGGLSMYIQSYEENVLGVLDKGLSNADIKMADKDDDNSDEDYLEIIDAPDDNPEI